MTKDEAVALDNEIMASFRTVCSEAGIDASNKEHQTEGNLKKVGELWNDFAKDNEKVASYNAALKAGDIELPEEMMGEASGGWGQKDCNHAIEGAAMGTWGCLAGAEVTAGLSLIGAGVGVLGMTGAAIASAVHH